MVLTQNIFVEKKVDSGDSSDEEPLSKKAKKLPPTNDEILELVKELLDGADLEKITMKSVCKQVNEPLTDESTTELLGGEIVHRFPRG